MFPPTEIINGIRLRGQFVRHTVITKPLASRLLNARSVLLRIYHFRLLLPAHCSQATPFRPRRGFNYSGCTGGKDAMQSRTSQATIKEKDHDARRPDSHHPHFHCGRILRSVVRAPLLLGSTWPVPGTVQLACASILDAIGRQR